MARSVGLPARVAVGFTPGTVDAATGDYVVTNFEAHAWPEVWLPGVGWSNRFEPTPPSGEPGGSALPGDTADTAVAPTDPDTPSTSVGTSPGAAEPVMPDTVPGTPVPTEVQGGGGGVPAWVLVALGALVLVVAGVAAVPLAKARRRAARRRRPDPAERVAGAWEEALDRLRELGEPRPTHHTPGEVALRADPLVGPDAAARLVALADAHTDAQFRGRPVTDTEADAAWEDCDDFRRALGARLGLRGRLRARLTPLRERTPV
jgi:hypothetical protein